MGAGASYAARNPSPPLGDFLLGYIKRTIECYEKDPIARVDFFGLDKNVYKQVKCFLETYSDLSYEKAINEYIKTVPINKKKNNEVLLGITKITALTLLPYYEFQDCTIYSHHAFKTKTDLYDSFLQKLGSKTKKTTFISLNYDILLRQALLRQNMIDSLNTRLYGWEKYSCKLELLKIHGSANWVGNHSGTKTDSVGRSYFLTIHEDSYEYVNTEVISENGIDTIASSYNRSIIALFCEGKPVFTNKTLSML
ncbi:MAG: hypothetical protein R3A45_08865 [Bdellovibrionota bacterium]